MSAKIVLTLEGAFAVIRVKGFLGDNFGEFRRCIEGAIYDKAKKVNRATIDKMPGIIVRLREADMAVECDEALTRALAAHTTQLWNDLQAAKERAELFDVEMRTTINPATGEPYYLYPFQRSGISWLSMKHGALLADDMGLGKALAKDEPVLTPGGWRPIGELRVGDEVVGFRGAVTRVTGVFPQGRLPVFRLSVGRDRHVTASDDHLWLVMGSNGGVAVVKTTSELRAASDQKWLLPILDPDAESATLNSIEPAGEAECVCISVAAEDKLYVTRDYILTHNTIQTIAAMPANPAVVVVCPAVAKSVWLRELRRWRPQLRVSVLSGKGNFRWPKPGEVVVTNYDILPDCHAAQCIKDRKDTKSVVAGQHDQACLKGRANLFVPALQHLAMQCKGCLKVSSVAKQCQGCLPFLKEAPDGGVVVFDEAHNLKNGNAQRTIRSRALSTSLRSKGGRCWLLTATPLLNHPVELWSVFQAALIAQEVFGDFKHFLKLFGGKAASEYGGYVFGTPETEEIAERMQRVMLRRMKKDVLQELPKLTTRTVTVDVDAHALKACDAFVKKHGGVDKIAETLGKTLDFSTMSTVGSALATAKIPAMMEMVESYEDQEEPLVVFSAHRAPVDLLADRPGWATITGDTSNEKRGKIVDSFQAGDLKGVACTIRAGGVSITLTRACNLIFVDEEWTPGLNIQARDRVLRIGQQRPVLITKIVADHPLDERIAELNAAKQALIDASVDGAEEMTETDREGHEEQSEQEAVDA